MENIVIASFGYFVKHDPTLIGHEAMINGLQACLKLELVSAKKALALKTKTHLKRLLYFIYFSLKPSKTPKNTFSKSSNSFKLTLSSTAWILSLIVPNSTTSIP